MQKYSLMLYCAAAITLLGFSLALTSCGSTPLTETPPEMVGTWQGEATIIVAWVDQERLPVTLTIHANGTVEGLAGDTTLIEGRLRKNLLGSPYIIRADLAGPIIAAEEVQRDGVSMPLDFDGEKFVGGLATTGTKAGGKESMILTASDLVLTRVQGDQ